MRTRICAYQAVRNICFSENLACFVFLKHPFWDSPFCLITDVIEIWTIFLKCTNACICTILPRDSDWPINRAWKWRCLKGKCFQIYFIYVFSYISFDKAAVVLYFMICLSNDFLFDFLYFLLLLEKKEKKSMLSSNNKRLAKSRKTVVSW